MLNALEGKLKQSLRIILDIQDQDLSVIKEILTESAFLKRTSKFILVIKETVYNFDLVGNTGFHMIDYWNGKQFVNGGKRMFENQLSNLNGKTLMAAGFDYAPFTTSVTGRPVFDGIEVLFKGHLFEIRLNCIILVSVPDIEHYSTKDEFHHSS
jgi:hypothetical protein